MQEAGMSIFLFLFCSRYHFWTLRLPIYYANIKSTLETLFLCWHFFSTTMLICMVDAQRSFDLVTVSTRNANNTRRLFRQEPTFRLQ